MLQILRIENLALMERATLEFAGGFTAVTGETGAGKSVLLGALSLLSGNRADKSLIRQGEVRCVVEAVLDIRRTGKRLERMLAEAELPACEEGQLLLKRIIERERPSRVMINGGLATLGQLQQMSFAWIDFHGPGEPQKLFHEAEQLQLLDLFAGNREQLAQYRRGYADYRASLARLEELQTEESLSPDEAAFLRSQVEGIDDLKLSAARVEQLEQNYQRLSHANEWRDLVERIGGVFGAEDGLTDQLRSCVGNAQRLAQIDGEMRPLADRIESLMIELDDLAEEFNSLAENPELGEDDARQIEQDMENWLSLSRKYGPAVERVLARREAMAAKLSLQGNLKGVVAEQQAIISKQDKALRVVAAELKTARQKAAQQLSRQAEKLLRELGFKHPRLQIEVFSENELGQAGDSGCRITFAPNPGMQPAPLNKIASSGEMARVMLALKSVMAATDATPVLVFDEVDSNIGGEVASAVARLLKALGQQHQVFCITHLPQVASSADHHFVVSKEQSTESTSVDISCIDNHTTARLDEFARMLGDRNSSSARQHAASLLENAGA